MDLESIGKAAGVVWSFLRENSSEGVSFAELKKIKGVKADEALLGVGWLAREGKLQFTGSASKVNVSLVESERDIVAQT
jgi:hypothetical protein